MTRSDALPSRAVPLFEPLVRLFHNDDGRIHERALRIHVQAYGRAHSDTLQTRKDLADALLMARRYDDAIAAFREVLQTNVPVKPDVDFADARFDPLRRLPAFRDLQAASGDPSSAGARGR